MSVPKPRASDACRLWRRARIGLAVTAVMAVVLWLWLPVAPRLTIPDSSGGRDFRFSPDGRLLLSTHLRPIVKGPVTAYVPYLVVWDVDSGQQRERIESENVHVDSAMFTPEGDLLLVDDDDGKATARSLLPGREQRNLYPLPGPHPSSQHPIQFSPDGRLAAARQSDGSLIVWDVTEGKERRTLASEEGLWVRQFAFRPDNVSLGVVFNNGHFETWNLDTGDRKTVFNLREKVSDSVAEAVADDYRRVLTMGNDASPGMGPRFGTVTLWDVNTGEGKVLFRPKESSAEVEGIEDFAFSPDGKIVGFCVSSYRSPSKAERQFGHYLPWEIRSHRSEVVFYDTSSGERRDVLPHCWGHGVFSPDGKTYAARGPRDIIQLWDVPPRRPLGLLLKLAAVPGALVWAGHWGYERRRRRKGDASATPGPADAALGAAADLTTAGEISNGVPPQ